jgi:hypothetical protein
MGLSEGERLRGEERGRMREGVALRGDGSGIRLEGLKIEGSGLTNKQLIELDVYGSRVRG